MKKSAIVIGAAGFVGYHLVKALSEQGYHIYAVVRPKSTHNCRIIDIPGVDCIELGDDYFLSLSTQVLEPCDYFFQLAWMPIDRYDYWRQMDSMFFTVKMLEIAVRLGCKRFVGIGSQAEYGFTTDLIKEYETPVQPYCGYGMAKVATCYMTQRRAAELGIEWVWGRIFSVFGKYEPKERLIPYIIDGFSRGAELCLSSCRQNWDFLYGSDVGTALIAMAEHGKNGEIYNIANGNYRPLREFVDEIMLIMGVRDKVIYGNDPKPFVSLQPSVEKLINDTGWYPKVSFAEGVRELIVVQKNKKYMYN